jgi:hypothetical protein
VLYELQGQHFDCQAFICMPEYPVYIISRKLILKFKVTCFCMG